MQEKYELNATQSLMLLHSLNTPDTYILWSKKTKARKYE